jgi:arylamine N-acetyltransferase
LEEGATATHIAPAKMRLVKENLIEFTDPTQKVWIYQTRYNPESSWLSQISFSEQEFLPQDFAVMNFNVSKNRSSWFTQRFICVRFLMDDSGKEIVGQCIMAGKEVKQRMRGQTEVLQVMQNEEDRVKALAKYFDMHLRPSEIQGIRNLSSQLR